MPDSRPLQIQEEVLRQGQPRVENGWAKGEVETEWCALQPEGVRVSGWWRVTGGVSRETSLSFRQRAEVKAYSNVEGDSKEEKSILTK